MSARATGMPLARPYRVDLNLILVGDMSGYYDGSISDRVSGDVVEVGPLDANESVVAVASTASGIGTVTISVSKAQAGPFTDVATIYPTAAGGNFVASINGKQLRDRIGENVRWAKATVSGTFAPGLNVFLQPSLP